MATILPFIVQHKEEEHRARPPDHAAVIIIFPGVRYERIEDCSVKAPSRRAAMRRYVRTHDELADQ